MFGTILTVITTCMQIYVFWRLCSVRIVRKHVSLNVIIAAGVALWAIFLFGRSAGHDQVGTLYQILEFFAMNWIASLFLISVSLLLIDIVTLFGFILPQYSSRLRGWALITGIVLSVFALIQGLRSPVISEYEVVLPNLPKTLDGTVAVALSDLHLGSLIGKEWLKDRIIQVKEQKPDIILFLGDVFEGHGASEEQFITLFKQLSAPLGVWAVSGNHDYHRNNEPDLLEKAGFRLLKNEWVEISPGFFLSGVENLSRRSRNTNEDDPIAKALSDLPAGATIFLSHIPWYAERISEAGVGLMLSGHTHGGQIWPFKYLELSRYPLMEGRYEVNGMTVLVCRGTGTWGPRMRLWKPGEILRITLRVVK